MPELPEVENVKRGLHAAGIVGQRFSRVELMRSGLRVPFPPGLGRKLKGQTILSIERRAKFLLFETELFYVLNHLGMTGSWRAAYAECDREARAGTPGGRKHDHIIFHFISGLRLILNDPRRFGLLDLFKRSPDAFAKCAWLSHLGVEPLDPSFNGDLLYRQTRGSKTPIKTFIMDQKRVVGVGNIYASEALFYSGIRPTRPARSLTKQQAALLADNIKTILRAAIDSGGSTISDYRNPQGLAGSFQSRFQVYDRARNPCLKCGEPIRSRAIAGRNTFWCPNCQR